MQKNIAIFGGTFDPIHIGHMQVMDAVYNNTPYNTIICVPTSQNPLKSWSAIASNEHRLAMLQLVLKEKSYIDICNYEIINSGKSYTVDTVDFLKQQYNINQKIGLIVGADIIGEIEKWKEVKRLSTMIELIIIPRSGITTDNQDYITKAKQIFENVLLLESVLTNDISSKAIRSNLFENKQHLDSKVLEYIVYNDLYTSPLKE